MILIIGAYILSGRHISGVSLVNAESTDAILKTYAAKDSDNDGLPDWEEALYGTDPQNPHSVRANLTDGEAVAQGLATPRYSGQPASATSTENLAAKVPGTPAAPDSLTEQFSRLFFNNYMATRGDTPPTTEQTQAFVQDAVTELSTTRVLPDAFSASQMKISGSGPAALTAYAVQAELIFQANNPRLPYDELTYFSDATDRNDATALANVAKIAESYTNRAKALAGISVPQEASSAQLSLVSTMARLGNTIADLAAVKNDPMRAMLGLAEYQSDVDAFAAALSSMHTLFVMENIDIAKGQPGYSFEYLTSFPAIASSSPGTP